MIRLKYLRAENFKSLRDIDIAFPETGSILIEGLNESGKSTLFEAVYFALYGRPLIADGGIESTIRYGTQESFVELGLMVDATEMVIARSTRVGRQNRAKLTITRPGESPEVVASVAAINKRMVAELRLDGETLLNSCFVEQKKLQRLEGMDAGKRLDSLMRLLNLEGLTRLASEFRVTAKDEEAIRRAMRQRDLAQVRVDIPARELDLETTSRRLAARRILTSLERIDGHRTAIADLEQQRDSLQAEQSQLKQRLDRIVALTQVDQLLASVIQTEVRRQTEASVEERARAAVADVVLVRDVELPKLVERLESVQELAAQVERLEILEAAIRALHEGAAAVADAADQERRAAALERERDDVDGQLAIAARLHDALQQTDALIYRIEQLDRARSNVEELDAQRARLEERAQALPAERERAAALTQSAATLEEAETNSENTRLRHDLLLEADRALTTAAVARTERQAAADDLQSRSAALDAARMELRDARAALTQSPAPALRSWIRARAASDRASEAREQESDAARKVEAANVEERRATAAAASATVQGVLFLAGGVAAGIGGAAVLTLLGSPVGILLLAIGVILGGVGARSLAARGRHTATAEHARNQHSLAQQHQTDLRMTVAAAGESAEQMREAESMLQDLGYPAPGSAAEAQQRLAMAEANEAGHDQAQALEREAAAHEAQCNQLHVDAEVRLRSAEATLEAAERDLGAARQVAAVGADADVARLIEATAADATRATERVEFVRAQAARMLDAPSPERLRIEAAQARAAIDESDRQVSELAPVAQRLAAESQRADDLERTNGAHRTTLHELVAELDLDIVAADDDADAFRSALEQRLGGFDEADLRRTQARLSADIGAASETAQRQRSTAATAWQNAGELASRSVTGSAADTLASAAGGVTGAARRNAQSRAVGDLADMRDMQGVWDAERSRLAAMSAVLGERFDLQRLRAASTELHTRRSHMEVQVAHLPVLQEQAARAVDAVSRTDTELEAAWRDVDERLDALGVRYAERAADLLHEQVGVELNVLDERTTRGRFDRVLGAIAETAEGIRQRSDRIAEDQREIAARLLEVTPQSPVLERDDIAAVLPEIADDELPLESSLVEERDDLRAAITHLQAVQRELEAELDLTGVPLDLAERESELAALIKNRAIKKRATGIITMARTRMIDRVLPGTEQNLRLLLPSLTAERYMDAQLDAEYRLSVWDAAAQRYVAKDIFSGGTRDQFSLALRLAFALATLPQELGTTPGFIFLDEPLSAFDQPRTAALVDLLTQGQIAKSFAQIFLISHSRSFDPQLFPYYLRMEDGRVAETSLPRLPDRVELRIGR